MQRLAKPSDPASAGVSAQDSPLQCTTLARQAVLARHQPAIGVVASGSAEGPVRTRQKSLHSTCGATTRLRRHSSSKWSLSAVADSASCMTAGSAVSVVSRSRGRLRSARRLAPRKASRQTVHTQAASADALHGTSAASASGSPCVPNCNPV